MDVELQSDPSQKRVRVPAEAVVTQFEADLTPEAKTEWQQKVAWIYYVAGDDENARRVAAKAQDDFDRWWPRTQRFG